ncbi:MAG: hypothetical protein AB8G18_04700 [Gammaproteobacteria bacterium]
MNTDWGVVGCAYMSKEYCKVLISKGINPQVFSRNLESENVQSFQEMFPQLDVKLISENRNEVSNWLVCTNIESHEEVCSQLEGNIYCEKPYCHTTDYDGNSDIVLLMNRRYYYWVNHIKDIIDAGKISKIIAVIPEKGVDALITQSIHVIDLLWHLAGPFGDAVSLGDVSPSYMLTTQLDIPLVINMNYGSHENFSLRFYGVDGSVFEAKPLEAFSTAEGMEVRQPDDEIPFRSYRPIVSPLAYVPTSHKPGLDELIDDLIQGSGTRLPSLAEHQRIHAWMAENML